MHAYPSRLRQYDTAMAYMLGTSGRANAYFRMLARDLRPDVIHWHNTSGFIDVPEHLSGAVSLATSHDYYWICPRSSLVLPEGIPCNSPRGCLLCTMRGKRPPQLWRIGHRRAIEIPEEVHILSPSEFHANVLRSYGFNVSKVLRNFVPDGGCNLTCDAGRANSLMYLGSLEPHKGIMTLLRAFELGVNSHGFSLEIVGEGHLRKKIEQFVRVRKLEGRVTIRGYLMREDWSRILQGSSRLVVPSECLENAPLSALEALSMGTPVIGSNIGGLPEILEEDSGSLLFKAGDYEELAEILSREWNRIENTLELRARARRAYEAKFSPQVFIKEYEKTIRELA